MNALWILGLACTGTASDETGVSEPEDTNSVAQDTASDPFEEIRAVQPSSLLQGENPCREPELLEVDYVHDGDTLFVVQEGGGSQEKVRIIGLDTPEIDPVECYGEEARDYLRSLLPEGQLVWLSFDTECEDDYGRSLAYVHLGAASVEEFVNWSLLRHGFATVYTWDDTDTFADLFVAAEADAREEDLGLWSACE